MEYITVTYNQFRLLPCCASTLKVFQCHNLWIDKNHDIDLALYDIAFVGGLRGDKLSITSLKAVDEEKSPIVVEGSVDLKRSYLDIKAKAQDLHALKGKPIDARFDLDVSVKGPMNGLSVEGDIVSRTIDITLPERFGVAIDELNVIKPDYVKQAKGGDVTLDLNVMAKDKVFVRGWGLDAEFGGKLYVEGTSSNPLIYGSFDIIRGRYEEFGKKFKLPKAQLRFDGAVPPSPKIDVLAETKINDVMAQVGITGSSIDPKIKFTSKPQMPEDEVMAYILFGQGMDNLSPFQLVQLTQTLARFSGQGGGDSLDPLGAVRDGIGLDDLSVGLDEAGGARVGAGKYVAEGVYLEVETGSEQGSGSASVEIELTPHITLESKVGQDASAGAGVFWKWDY